MSEDKFDRLTEIDAMVERIRSYPVDELPEGDLLAMMEFTAKILLKGQYAPINDGCGIVGYSYKCPECEHENKFKNCDDGCDQCGFSEPYVDPDEWYDAQMQLPVAQRAWNRGEK